VVGPGVRISQGCTLYSHVVVGGETHIGVGNELYPFCSIGLAPQDLKYHGEKSVLEIGDNNIIREYVTLQPGTEGGGFVTRIGSKNLFMANSHVGHDCMVGDGNVLANSVALAGHVLVGNFVTLGGLVGVHQFCRVGNYSFLGAGSMVAGDIPPFSMAQGDRAKISGVNTVGLKRRGYETSSIRAIRRAFRTLFGAHSAGVLLQDRLASALQECNGEEAVQELIDFVSRSERGVAPGRLMHDDEES
jgi:UDP-N-acetylglucosamine acyltransferase